MHALVPLILALSGIPALLIAGWTGRGDDPRSRGLGLRWALVALTIMFGAAALYWAGTNKIAIYAVVIVLVVSVNALAISMLRHLRRSRGERTQ